ncbi:MAG: hypothetical protein R3E89_03775 [Thiolinea sp.]
MLILGNHGLVVAAESVAQAEALLETVVARLTLPERAAEVAVDAQHLAGLAAGSGFRPAAELRTHQLAFDALGTAFATPLPLYPDHVVFLGPGAVVADSPSAAQNALQVHRYAGVSAVKMLIVPQTGVFVSEQAGDGADAMALCLSDVARRIPAGGVLNYLSEQDLGQLLNWDAEQYRMGLNKSC